MRESQLRRMFRGFALVATILISGSAMPRIAAAQGTAQPGNVPITMDRDYDDDRDDTDWGWIGLLGLAGLLGLRRRNPERERHFETSTTPRP